MAEPDQEGRGASATELGQAVSRLLPGLQEESRAARLRALGALRALMTEGPPPAVREVFGPALLRPLTRCLAGDPAERCRELALELLRLGLGQGAHPSEALPVLMPALAQRLGLPQGPGEACEELRLGLLQLLTELLRRCDRRALAPFLPEAVGILRAALLDPFPPAKREGCQAAAAAAYALPDHFHLQSESLINPLMQAISHQHYKVRVAVIHATGSVIQFGNVKSLDDVLSHLAQRCFDDIPQVREAVISVVGEWLLHLRDRYSYFHKLIPLLLSGLTDEMHENKELALTYWKKVGLQWEKENEDDIKDKLDFYTEPSYYPPGLTRPDLGCRELVTRNIFKILPGLCHDITDWVKGTRVKASQLLFILLQHAEDHITQHMELLLRTLYRVCSDEESSVISNVFYLEQLLCCVESLIELCQEDCKEISLQLTKVLVTIMAIPTAGHLHVKLEDAMSALAEVQHIRDVTGLYKQHISQLMGWLSSTHDGWSCCSPELLQLDVIATQSGPVIAEVLKDFISILKTCLQTSRDPRMRLKLFSILSQLLQNPGETVNSKGQFGNYLEIVIKDILSPNLQWQAGRTAAAIRTTAVACLWALICSELLSPEELQNVRDALMPQIIVTLEEDSKMTRLISCQIIRTFLDNCRKQPELSKIYPEILKRLDDVSHDVRLAAADALTSWFRCINDPETKALLKTNIKVLYQELLVHLDDPDQNIQLAVLDTLKEGGVLYPDLLAKEIEGVVHKHRTPIYCDQLLLHLESTGWSYSES
uniref:Dynein axonemal assembly factor 5 n=1 Tax=Pseudonaja textilis TaxID=8673 RepID=A0A670YBA6_PSETE